MPKRSNKEKIIELILYFGYDSLLEKRFAISEPDETLSFLELVQSKRYLMERTCVPKTLSWSEVAFLNEGYDDDRFRGQFRMNKDSFNQLIPFVAGHPAFNETQDPIQLQLGVTLFRLGTFGNASSVGHVATKFGISEGSVVNFTERTISAITALSRSWIRWPDKKERVIIGTKLALKGLPKCIGFVDGTDIDLSEAPHQDKEVYWSRKKKYCLQAQIICDSDRIIRDFFIGYPGSVHDAKVFVTSPIGANPQKYFSKGEFLIGDSAYPLTETVIVPFRKLQSGLPEDKKSFNYNLSQHRVVVENTIGLLKGRFQSLKGLRIRISAENNGHKRVCNWTHTCAILHNMLTANDPWLEEYEEMNDERIDEIQEEEDEGLINCSTNKKGHLKRLALLAINKAL